jgi:hypothetical protein
MIRVLSALAVLLTAALFLLTTTAVGNARESVRVIGHDAGPQVVATADLYFALSDMDAQVANVLLIGREHNLGAGRDRALELYQQRRTEANAALLHATDLTGADPTERETIRDVLDGLGRYERLASEAILLDQQADHAAGPPPAAVLDRFRQANDLMRLELLPKAYNLTLESGTIVRKTYEDKRSAVLDARWALALVGLAALAVLAGLQRFLAARFRRRINPALALATLGTVVLLLAGTGMLSGIGSDLKSAKQQGFDPILSLSRARAISNSMHADESRYLLDPQRSDTYEQVYFEQAQSILYVDAGNLFDYRTKVTETADAYADNPLAVDFLGFLGDEGRAGLTLQDAPLERVLPAYEAFQLRDGRMRQQKVAGQVRGAIDLRMGALAEDFDRYDRGMVDLIRMHQQTFDDAIASADDRLGGWTMFPPVIALIIAALVFAGVAPRLAEYR